MCNLQNQKLTMVFGLLLDTVASVHRVMKSKSPLNDVLLHDEHPRTAERKNKRQTTVFGFMKRADRSLR